LVLVIDKAYLLYLVLMAIFGWLCYRFGHAVGVMEELELVVHCFMGHDLGPDDPAPEEDQ
jgi:hypothetical protein